METRASIGRDGSPQPSASFGGRSSATPGGRHASAHELEHYIALGRSAGCPEDQMLNFASVGIILQERQLLASAVARRCDHKEGPSMLGYGGARCGGKSHWLIAQMGGDDCQRYPGLKCLLLRKVGKSNLESFGDLRRRIFRKLLRFPRFSLLVSPF